MLQVIWVDLLTKAEFEAGFGSHTPMFSGQTKCVRYYMNFARGLALFKKTCLQVGRSIAYTQWRWAGVASVSRQFGQHDAACNGHDLP